MITEDQQGSGLGNVSLADAFTIEHHEIDAGIEKYLADTDSEGDALLRARPLISAMEALRRHIRRLSDQKTQLPAGPLMMALMVMRKEHGEIWRRMAELSQSLSTESADEERVEQLCQEILALLDRHNSKEEPVIYPHMDADLNGEEQRLIRELLEGGALPEGWVCQALR